MFYLLAQAETANQEHVVNHLLNMVENVLTNPIAITMIFAMGTSIVVALMKHRYDLRRAEIDATLKQEMIQRGMSAEEIERVLTAKSDAKPGRGAVEKQTSPYTKGDAK